MSGEWNGQYLTYEQSVELFSKTLEGGKSVFSNLQGYFDEILKKFNSFIITQAPSSSPPQPQIKQRSATTLFKQPIARNSTSTLIPEQSNPLMTLRESANSLIAYNQYLRDSSSEYQSKMQEVIHKANSALKTLKEAKSRRELAYEMYLKTGEELKLSYDKKYANIVEMQQKFLEFQKNAVDAHTHMNEVTAQTAMKMESAISEFEDIEKWRSDKLKEVIDKLSNWLQTLKHDLGESNTMLQVLLSQIPSDETIEKSMDTNELLDPAADSEYQIIPIDLLFSKFIPKDELFKEEQKQGRLLYEVISECEAHGKFLKAVTGEIVVALEVDDQNIKARDINDCEGLIPLAAVRKL